MMTTMTDDEIKGCRGSGDVTSPNSSTPSLHGKKPPTVFSHKKKKKKKSEWRNIRLLVRLVEQHGLRRWSHIAKMLNGRIGKQCRERWHNHLRPNIKKDTWSEEEDMVLIQAHSEIGNKWAEIAKRLPGRTENSIKNRWNATKRRQFSVKRCRSSKYPRSGSLLQNYIKSLTPASVTPVSVLTTEDQKTVCNRECVGPVSYVSTPPMGPVGSETSSIHHVSSTNGGSSCYIDDVPGLLDKKSMHGTYDHADLFDRLGCDLMASGSEGIKNFDMAMEWDVSMPSLLMPESSENVKREMDLVEMMSQNNMLHSPL